MIDMAVAYGVVSDPERATLLIHDLEPADPIEGERLRNEPVLARARALR